VKIPITKTYTNELESKAVCEVLDSGWLVQGKKISEFERNFCELTSSKFAVATSNCTTSLHLSLLSLNLKEGDKIIVPSFTHTATANVVEYINATPVFVDVELETFNIDVKHVSEILIKDRESDNPSIKGIIPVHLFGLCANMTAIMDLAKKYNLFVIEDAACALGSYHFNKHAGTFGDTGCFSFHPRKSITTGEGGMIITDNPSVERWTRSARAFGGPHFDKLGYNYRITDIQGAIGVEQLKKFSFINSQRVRRAKIYNERLSGIEWLKTPQEPKNYKHAYQSYVILVNAKEINAHEIKKATQFRDAAMERLSERGIYTRHGTHAVHALEYYKRKYNLKDGDFLNSLAADRMSITLPLYPQMSDKEQEYVINAIKEI